MEETILEKKECKQCGMSFASTKRDRDFLDKISPTFSWKKYTIPSPTHCPDCRQQRRLAQRNERNFYKRACEKTGKDMVSIYSPDKPCVVYDQKIWRGEERDQAASGQKMDFQKSFFDQYSALSLKAPRPSLINMSSENAEYTNHSAYNKDCYMCINTWYSENCMYCTNYCIYDTTCLDCLNIHHCENCYYCTDVKQSQDCSYLYNCIQCFKCSFCEDCQDCNNCFLCTNLRHKSFCIENKQYSKEAYKEVVDHYYQDIAKWNIAALQKKYQERRQLSFYKNVIIEQSERASGDHIYTSKDTQDAYYVFDMDDCSYCYDAWELKNSYDAYEPFRGEHQYETHACNLGYTLMCCSKCYECTRVYYSQYCRYCKDCFWCFGLRNKQWHIFNTPYSEAEYEREVAKIIQHMQTTGERGEFFPATMSIFGYNETAANDYFPLHKDDAIQQWFRRSDYEAPFPKVERVFRPEELPRDIQDISDEILEQAILCEVIGKPFKIIKKEFEFYRRHHLPLPTKHPDVRHAERMLLRTPRKLWQRNCIKCWGGIQTTYAPSRPEHVYCEQCYDKEIYG